jgi:hypothetical protein
MAGCRRRVGSALILSCFGFRRGKSAFIAAEPRRHGGRLRIYSGEDLSALLKSAAYRVRTVNRLCDCGAIDSARRYDDALQRWVLQALSQPRQPPAVGRNHSRQAASISRARIRHLPGCASIRSAAPLCRWQRRDASASSPESRK